MLSRFEHDYQNKNNSNNNSKTLFDELARMSKVVNFQKIFFGAVRSSQSNFTSNLDSTLDVGHFTDRTQINKDLMLVNQILANGSYYSLQRGSEYRTSKVFKWSKRGWMTNGLVFKFHLNTGQPDHLNIGQMDAIWFSYGLVLYLNGWFSTQDIAHKLTI